MLSLLPSVRMTIGTEAFSARLRCDLAPRSCAQFEELLPYRGKVIHARWSGESFWSPLTAVWPSGLILPPENAIGEPAPGQVLLSAGGVSEPELLIAYGPSRFASKSGPLFGNPVLTIEDRLAGLAELGRQIHWHGAMNLSIEFLAEHDQDQQERES
jgi:hypothetical protein